MLKDIFLNGAAAVSNGRGDRAAAFEVSLVHHLPGRLRLRALALRNDARAGADAKERLAAVAGVRSVTINPQTGSLLLEYDPAVIAPDRIVELLASRGFTFSRSETAAKSATEPRLFDRLIEAIKSWAFDTLTEHLAYAMIGAIA